MTDPVARVVASAQSAEAQLQEETAKLTNEIRERENEVQRAKALFKLFEEKRIVDDVKSGRLCQPPVFFEAWNATIGRMTQYVKGADEGALGQMFESFQNTLQARSASHKAELLAALQ